MAPTSVPCASSSGEHETHNDGKITRCEHGQPRRSSSQDRRSVASARPSGALASTAATTQTSASVPKSLQRCRCSPSSCSHHLPSNLPNARFVRGGEHGNFVRGDEAISSMNGCSLCMYRRCVADFRPILRTTYAQPYRLDVSTCVDLLESLDACTCCAQTLYEFRIGPGRVSVPP